MPRRKLVARLALTSAALVGIIALGSYQFAQRSSSLRLDQAQDAIGQANQLVLDLRDNSSQYSGTELLSRANRLTELAKSANALLHSTSGSHTVQLKTQLHQTVGLALGQLTEADEATRDGDSAGFGRDIDDMAVIDRALTAELGPQEVDPSLARPVQD